jgi:hypothetical protein
MATFIVHVPPETAGSGAGVENAVFVREGFSYPAFLFGPFWLLWKRAWIPAVLWAVLLALLAWTGSLLKIPPDAVGVVAFALSAMLGVEGDRVLAWSLRRRGYVESDVVIGDNEAEAEEVFFGRLRGRAPVAAESGP